MADLPHFEPRMSDAEGLMWRLEKDPYLSSTFANVTVLDRPPDVDRLRRRLERAAAVFPRLRQRVQPAPANLGAPRWVDDPDFDIAYHVRHVALPGPGTMRRLCDLATLIAADPFDRTRPLWEFVVVDGLSRGRAALVQKMHHTLTDGEGGVRLSLQFLDLERDAMEPPAPPVREPEAVATGSGSEALRDLLTGSLRLPLGMLRQLRELAHEPARAPEVGLAAADTVRAIVAQLSETDRARSPLWTDRSLRRRLEVMQVPFAPAKAAARRLGGSLNTAFVAAAAHAAGDYHRRSGAPVDELRASMAVSTRQRDSGANAFTLARLLVPTGEMTLAERFAVIAEASEAARRGSTTASLEVLAAVTSALPTSLVTRLARQQAQTVDFATSNVRGSSFPVYLAGAKILHNHPVGPLAGVAWNLTLLSYDGSLDMGLNIDPAAVANPGLLRRCLEAAFAELVG